MTYKNIFTEKVASAYIIVFVIISFLFGVILYAFWNMTLAEQDALIILEISQNPSRKERIKIFEKKVARLQRETIKGIYLTAYSAGSNKKMTEIINLINNTELNAVIIDIKDYSGKVLYNSNVELVNELELEDYRINKIEELITALHKYDIYVIARQTVFQDPILARKKSDWALKNKNGGVWYDYKGLSWVDPSIKEVWDYNIEIAKEAISLGFDEINFDYVRFPSDGNMSALQYNNGELKKYEVMGQFYEYLNDKLKKYPAKISLDLFGFVMEKTGEDDMNIGQRLEDALDEVDAISPMMYPSHYPSGHLGLANPAEYPGLVIKNGMEKGAHFFYEKKAVLRPWLQAFNIGAVYDANKIREQIDIVEQYTNGGWMLWNAANRYSTDGLELVDIKPTLVESFEEILNIDSNIINGDGF
ncbi:MAG: hypothetical protein A2725_02060 [Candidatus Magasanikbacteria bacterium RIFCSPHIGHO2_01_FULL_33_34]|uniref:DUF4015 domain-containing protein n=1 Tax=Candidatus Magasanikbacteria bacterium RIFCSPHIGHO2_01_FULL_33_34 TaxID=1798671 RepID=A0A1F6LK51_9BACT|nr:MAG: hypothetical protein A2725_02060 [Candidatus Magasanikbacteria bacterium RIFCSPHIGHO2_01_FULL_33_34]OGH65553.1 MAG: hypothetical protein A3B83_01635 [Candidatus Magasanikbacteria bacterium RIFCSPHIGHO2_02_FULL_33_17]OGH76263.1 MAG: hypothetical protein A3A89_02455 [Candidatus Magasanikbacteria bacterium RIFCSPLOWO2_01_FULL_33_34]OGH81114.1 MAG: hypothetical protein A3F93_00120 [Candidatus Magasanikbacteria bacterium RIFCSPLOWO2_12_FULL_34_7]